MMNVLIKIKTIRVKIRIVFLYGKMFKTIGGNDEMSK